MPKKIISITLILLHLAAFGPIREAFAFSASSASYRLNSATLNQGGKERGVSYSKLLLHFDSHNNSQNFKDEASKSIARHGNAHIDTAQSKFGSASGLFDGDSDYLTLLDSADWNFGSGDWTVDFWIRTNGLTENMGLFYQQSDAQNFGQCYLYSTGQVQFTLVSGNINVGSFSTTVAVQDAVWSHIAIVHYGTTYTGYINGISYGSMTDSDNWGDYTGVFKIGYDDNINKYFKGWIDELRISKGIARWTANFTVPASPYIIDFSEVTNSPQLTQDTLGEPVQGKSQSASYLLNSGLIPTLQTAAPILTKDIPYQAWEVNSSKENAFDLDDYFSGPEGYPLTFSVTGNLSIKVTIDPQTQMVSFSHDKDWYGAEKMHFLAADSEGNTVQSNEVAVQVKAPAPIPNKPVIVGSALTPSLVNAGDTITLTIKARDLDGQKLAFNYSDFFSQTKLYQEGELWVSEAAWKPEQKAHYTIKVTVTDPGGLNDTTEVVVRVGALNQPPVLEAISPIEVAEKDLAVVNPRATDADNDPVIYYFEAPFDSVGKWLPSYKDARSEPYSVKVTASDGIDTVSKTVKVTVKNVNQPPSALLEVAPDTLKPNETITITLKPDDPDKDDSYYKEAALSFTIKKDNGEVISGNRTTLAPAEEYRTTTSFADEGYYQIIAEVTDSGGKKITLEKDVQVTVRKAAQPVMGDFNGDALTDLGVYHNGSGDWEVSLSKEGEFGALTRWMQSFGKSDAREWQPMGGDFDGDGKTDVAVYNPGSGENKGQLRIALSTKASFNKNDQPRLTFTEASFSWQPFTGNFNGDKYTDFALYNKDTGEVKVALGGQGLAFGPFTPWLTGFGTDYIVMSGDFNADSLTDLCLFKKSSGEFKIAFSNTKEFVDGRSWFSGFAVNKDPLISDFNNDGLADAGYWDKASFKIYYAISTGEGFVNKGEWLDNFGRNSDNSATTGDFDGDGITDAAAFEAEAEGLGIKRWNTYRWNVYDDKDAGKNIIKRSPADLLTKVDNGIGGETKVDYTYAAKADNSGLPFPVYVASKISLINTVPAERAATYTQSFNFSGGYYDSNEREFRGFAKVKVSDPITGNYTETYFYQGKAGEDGALKGQIEKLIAYDGNARKISQSQNTYEVKTAGPKERFLGFPSLKETLTTVWEENNSSLSTKDKFTYDSIGNVTQEYSEGDTAVTGDEKSAATIYAKAYEAPPQGAGQAGFNRPLETSLKDKEAKVISKKSFEYDNKGNLTKETGYIFSSTLSPEPYTLIPVYYSYDSFGNLTSTTNAKGQAVITEYESDFYAYPQKVTNSLGHTIRYVYEPKFGALKSVTDSNGITSSTAYDSLGRVIHVKNGLNQITVSYSYPDFNTKVTTNAIGLSASEYIDGLGRKYKSVSSGEDGDSARKVVSEAFFNARGLSEKESLAHYLDEEESNISYIRYEYDIRGRVKKTISDFPGTLKDAESSINYISPLYTEATDPMGHKKGALKDVFGNIIEVTEFTQGGVYKTKYEYNIQNNLTKTTDSKGNITQIFYDSAGRKLKMLDPDMGAWSYEYDILGNLTKQTDAKAQVLTFEYDELNRLIKKSSLRGSEAAEAISEYFYDDASKDNCLGRLSKVTDQSGSTEFFYDKLGREVKSIKTVDSIQYVVVREYDILGRLTKLTYPDGEIVNYGYDANSGLLENVFSPGPSLLTPRYYVKDITYNAKGQLKVISYGNGTQTTYTYGQDLRLSRIFTKDQGGGTNLQDLNYLFDKNGNLTTLTDNLRTNIRTYFYDDLDRLTEAKNLPSPSGGGSTALTTSFTNFNYQYDSIGNMTYKSDLGVMTYGLSAGPHALTGAGGFTYKYDANGNMTQGKNKTLAYDIENRLTEVNELGRITTFTYDGDGGRVKKATSTSSTTYIGSLFEIESPVTGPQSRVKHIFAGANRICSRQETGDGRQETLYYHSDHLGSSSIITDSTGAQVQHLEYTPYGTTALSEGSDTVKHKFTGKELDSTGLYFYGARYYDPEIGRFITADTIVQAPYDPQSLNRYSYCRNNPINYIDPTGHKWSWKKFWKAAVGALVGVALGIALGPAGLAWYGATMSWAIGGAVGGAITGGLEGGWKGALIGGAMGGALGAFGGWASGVKNGGWIIGGMLAGGAGYAGATDSWDSFAGGLVGAIAAGGIASGFKEQFANFRAGNGFRSNADVIIAKIKSGEISWRQIVSYFNDSSTPVEIKSALVDLFNQYGFNLKEQSPGVWSQTWQKNTPKDFVGGLGAKVKGGTTLTIRYLGNDEYGLRANLPIKIGFLDTPLPFLKADFTSMDVYYKDGFIRALETDISNGMIRDKLMNGIDLNTGQ